MEDADNKEERTGVPKESTPKETTGRTSGLKGTRSLRKLRDRIELAAGELLRLREENMALQQRVEELEAMPVNAGSDGGLLLLDTDPEALKRKVEGFINSIDNYLEKKDSAD